MDPVLAIYSAAITAVLSLGGWIVKRHIGRLEARIKKYEDAADAQMQAYRRRDEEQMAWVVQREKELRDRGVVHDLTALVAPNPERRRDALDDQAPTLEPQSG